MISWIVIVLLGVVALLFYKLSHFRHKSFIIVMICLGLFLFATIMIVNSQNKLDFSTTDGFFNSMSIYTGWLANGFNNVVALGGNAIKMDWSSTNASFVSKDTSSKTKTTSSKVRK